MNPTKPVEPPKSIVIKTLTELAFMGMRNSEQFLDLAKEINNSDLNERPCCPFCEEVQCDDGCPLESTRDPIVDSWNKSPDSPQKAVSHVMPEHMSTLFEFLNHNHKNIPVYILSKSFESVKAAYAKIAELERERDLLKCYNNNQAQTIYKYEAQLSTLKAQMKEVVNAGEGIVRRNCLYAADINAWKAATAALRQSGQGSTE